MKYPISIFIYFAIFTPSLQMDEENKSPQRKNETTSQESVDLTNSFEEFFKLHQIPKLTLPTKFTSGLGAQIRSSIDMNYIRYKHHMAMSQSKKSIVDELNHPDHLLSRYGIVNLSFYRNQREQSFLDKISSIVEEIVNFEYLLQRDYYGKNMKYSQWFLEEFEPHFSEKFKSIQSLLTSKVQNKFLIEVYFEHFHESLIQGFINKFDDVQFISNLLLDDKWLLSFTKFFFSNVYGRSCARGNKLKQKHGSICNKLFSKINKIVNLQKEYNDIEQKEWKQSVKHDGIVYGQFIPRNIEKYHVSSDIYNTQIINLQNTCLKTCVGKDLKLSDLNQFNYQISFGQIPENGVLNKLLPFTQNGSIAKSKFKFNLESIFGQIDTTLTNLQKLINSTEFIDAGVITDKKTKSLYMNESEYFNICESGKSMIDDKIKHELWVCQHKGQQSALSVQSVDYPVYANIGTIGKDRKRFIKLINTQFTTTIFGLLPSVVCQNNTSCFDDEIRLLINVLDTSENNGISNFNFMKKFHQEFINSLKETFQKIIDSKDDPYIPGTCLGNEKEKMSILKRVSRTSVLYTIARWGANSAPQILERYMKKFGIFFNDDSISQVDYQILTDCSIQFLQTLRGIKASSTRLTDDKSETYNIKQDKERMEQVYSKGILNPQFYPSNSTNEVPSQLLNIYINDAIFALYGGLQLGTGKKMYDQIKKLIFKGDIPELVQKNLFSPWWSLRYSAMNFYRLTIYSSDIGNPIQTLPVIIFDYITAFPFLLDLWMKMAFTTIDNFGEEFLLSDGAEAYFILIEYLLSDTFGMFHSQFMLNNLPFNDSISLDKSKIIISTVLSLLKLKVMVHNIHHRIDTKTNFKSEKSKKRLTEIIDRHLDRPIENLYKTLLTFTRHSNILIPLTKLPLRLKISDSFISTPEDLLDEVSISETNLINFLDLYDKINQTDCLSFSNMSSILPRESIQNLQPSVMSKISMDQTGSIGFGQTETSIAMLGNTQSFVNARHQFAKEKKNFENSLKAFGPDTAIFYIAVHLEKLFLKNGEKHLNILNDRCTSWPSNFRNPSNCQNLIEHVSSEGDVLTAQIPGLCAISGPQMTCSSKNKGVYEGLIQYTCPLDIKKPKIEIKPDEEADHSDDIDSSVDSGELEFLNIVDLPIRGDITLHDIIFMETDVPFFGPVDEEIESTVKNAYFLRKEKYLIDLSIYGQMSYAISRMTFDLSMKTIEHTLSKLTCVKKDESIALDRDPHQISSDVYAGEIWLSRVIIPLKRWYLRLFLPLLNKKLSTAPVGTTPSGAILGLLEEADSVHTLFSGEVYGALSDPKLVLKQIDTIERILLSYDYLAVTYSRLNPDKYADETYLLEELPNVKQRHLSLDTNDTDLIIPNREKISLFLKDFDGSGPNKPLHSLMTNYRPDHDKFALNGSVKFIEYIPIYSWSNEDYTTSTQSVWKNWMKQVSEGVSQLESEEDLTVVEFDPINEIADFAKKSQLEQTHHEILDGLIYIASDWRIMQFDMRVISFYITLILQVADIRRYPSHIDKITKFFKYILDESTMAPRMLTGREDDGLKRQDIVSVHLLMKSLDALAISAQDKNIEKYENFNVMLIDFFSFLKLISKGEA